MKIPRFLQIALLILLAAGAQPAYSALWQWSRTASSNGGADPTINFQEGMSPSAVNDSARALMARTADWRDDISGSVVAGGTSTAYTMTTNASVSGNGIASPALDGQMLAFRAAATNGSAATLTVDGGTAYPLQTAAGTAAPAGTIVSGTPYRVSFSLASLAWVIEGGQGNPYAVPLGGLLPYTGTTAPNSNYILPAGQCISTTTYAAYWALMGSPASGACPGGQFAVIDMRGRVPAALDNLNGSAISRMTSSATGCGTSFTSVGAVCANGNESETLTIAMIPAHTHINTLSDPGHTHVISSLAAGGTFGGSTVANVYNGLSGNGATNANTTGVTITNASAGGGGAHSKVMPVIAVTYLLRVF